MAILNSQLFWWYLVNTGTTLANGYFRFMPHYIKSFPLPFLSKEIALSLDTLVNEILFAKYNSLNKDVKEIEEKIDQIIFDIYNLNLDEIKVIKDT